MRLQLPSARILAISIAAVTPMAALAQVGTINLTPVTIDFSKVNGNLPTIPDVSQFTLLGVEYRNTNDADNSQTPTAGDTARIDGVFVVTRLFANGIAILPPGMNITWEMTGTYLGLEDNLTGVANNAVTYNTDAQVGILTLYVSTDMTKQANRKTGLGYDDGTLVAQFAVHKSAGVYRILSPFDGSRDLLMLKQSALNGFFSPDISGATFDANLDADPDNNGVGGDAPIPSAWKYDFAGVNYPLRFFAEIDGSRRFGNIVDEGSCRMTGGSVDVNGNILLGPREDGAGSTDDRYQTGGQIGAPTAALPQPMGEWTHHQQPGGTTDKWTFHSGTASAPVGTKILSVQCSEPGYCQPARPAPFKRIAWDGIGTFKTAVTDATMLAACPTISKDSLHYYRAMVEDIGEPGAGGSVLKKKTCNHVIGTPISATDCKSCPDTYQIEIHCTTDPSSPVIYTVGGFIDGGNFQIHPPVGESLPATTTKGGGKK